MVDPTTFTFFLSFVTSITISYPIVHNIVEKHIEQKTVENFYFYKKYFDEMLDKYRNIFIKTRVTPLLVKPDNTLDKNDIDSLRAEYIRFIVENFSDNKMLSKYIDVTFKNEDGFILFIINDFDNSILTLIVDAETNKIKEIPSGSGNILL